MATRQELVAVLGAPESERVERKGSANDETAFGKSICALANDIGNSGQDGFLVYGLNDDGSASGASFGDQEQQRIAGWIQSGKVLPTPTVSIEPLEHDGQQYLILRVSPSNYPPVQYRGRVYKRIGPSTHVATPQDEHLLTERRRALAVSFDQIPMPLAKMEDLDLDFFRKEYLPQAVSKEVLGENQRSTDLQMRTLRILNPDGIPTLAGVLLLAFDPRQFIPGAFVHFRRIEGKNLTDPTLDSKQISGPLHQMMQAINDIVDINIKTKLEIGSSGREGRFPDYPKSALMQILINAVFHRSYENTNNPVRLNWFTDRIEISNPGGPFGQVTVENFGTGVTDYRNFVLGEMLSNLGWVQRFGFGIQEARRALEENGNPEIEFEREPTYILARIWGKQ